GQGLIVRGLDAGGTGPSGGEGILVDEHNRIVVVGFATNAEGNSDLLVWRFLENGELDRSFGNADGAERTGFFSHHGAAGGNGRDQGMAIALSGDGSLVVAGFSFNGTT